MCSVSGAGRSAGRGTGVSFVVGFCGFVLLYFCELVYIAERKMNQHLTTLVTDHAQRTKQYVIVSTWLFNGSNYFVG